MTISPISARSLARPAALVGAAAAIAITLAAPASAHVSAAASETAAGSYTVVTFSVPHGCDGKATTKVEISIPEGINSVTPTRNPYYDVAKQAEQLNPPVTDAHGNELTERIATVTYTAKTPLPDGFRDSFELSLQLPEDAAGENLAFPTIQTCTQGQTAWTEVAAEGQEGELESPAPVVTVTEASGEGHHGSTDEDSADEHGAGEHGDEHGDDEAAASAESAAAVDSDDSDDSGNGLAMAGLVTGVLGILVGGAALARSRKS
ncbi:MAG: YcnI family protein [Nocardioides sp.]